MNRNLINRKIVFKLSDPWDLGEQLGWVQLEATIINVKDAGNVLNSIVIKLAKPFDYKNISCEYFIASPRHEGDDFSQLKQKQVVFCGLTRISSDQIAAVDPFDLSHWRGGIGLIGEIELI